MNRCPVCNARFCAKTICRRCGADLTLMMRSVVHAAMLRYHAIETLLSGNPDDAERMLDTAQAIRQTSTHNHLRRIVKIVRILT